MTISCFPLGLVLLNAASARAEEPALYEAEVSLGYGVEMSGDGGMTTTRKTPLTIAATAAIAVRDEPRLLAFGGLVAETIEKNAVGATAGVRLEPMIETAMKIRVGGGATYLFAPYTMWGATGSVGACKRGKLALCGDLALTAYFAGSDLAPGRTVTEVQAVIGVAFDAM